jgi:predicted ATPase/class 3 adenylate cyclase
MALLPTGTVTFLFTDIEGSTKHWQQDPDAMRAALARHHELLQTAIASNGGYVFQIVGDAFCAAFHTAPEGLAAAIAGQRALTRERWTDAVPILVRMAIHTGTAEIRAGDYKSGEYASGLTLSRAARLLSAAHGGQILVSAPTQQLVRDQLPGSIELRDLGGVRLRDLAVREHVFQVVAPDLPVTFPAPRGVDVALNNLPVQLTRFIGRTREKSELARLLGGGRLLTVTGPGGSGKTRLSLELAGDLLGQYPDGAWLIELASLSDPTLVPQAAALALDVREEANRSWLMGLVEHLRPKQVLLVLDNCEHLLDASAHLADALLRACPGLTILATSREPLGVSGEVVFRVPSLSLPDLRRVPGTEQVGDSDAVRLFVDRAAAAKTGFTLTDANAGAVARVCQRLDGIPLAIELAAARVRGLTVQQIASHLDERFRLLTGGSRAALPRHQTLRGLIDWSYDLLSETERTLFRRLTAFTGGWTLEAAAAVCADPALDRHAVVDVLGRLVDKSLVLADEQGGDDRYRLLETIRQYGLERLGETTDGEIVRDRHRDFYLAFAEDAERGLQGAEQVRWLQRLEMDHDNMRTALRWSLERGATEQALRLGSAMWPFWDTRGYISEGREWLEELLACGAALSGSGLTPASRRARARVLDGAAYLRTRRGEIAAARELFTRSAEWWRELGEPRGVAEALNNAGHQTNLLGDRALGRRLVEESLALFRELGDARGIAHALNNLAEILTADSDHTRARQLIEESVPLFRASEDTRGLSHALNNLGAILVVHDEYDRAERSYEEGLRLAQQLDDRHGVATALRSLGTVAHHQHDYSRACDLYAESVDRFRGLNDTACLARSLISFALTSHERGDQERARVLGDEGLSVMRGIDLKGELAQCLDQLGHAALSHGDVERATRLLTESLTLSQTLGHVAGVAGGLQGLAGVAGARRQPTTMVRLMAAATQVRLGRGIPLSPRERDAHASALDAARAALDTVTFDAAWAEGAAMPLEAAIACAVALADPAGARHSAAP